MALDNRQMSDTLGSATVQQLIGGTRGRFTDEMFSKSEQPKADDSATYWVMILFFGLVFAAMSIDDGLLTKECNNKRRTAIFTKWAAVFVAVSSTYGLFRMRRSVGRMFSNMFSAM